MSFNYEQSIWGKGTASLKWTEPTSFRLRQSLWAVKNLSKGSQVLEVGCGAGQFIRAVKKNRPELSCYGCDISQKAIDEAKKDQADISYKLSGENKLPDADKSFDAVLVFDVFEHAQDVNGLLGEIRRVLKTDGIFYCYVPCEGDWLSIWHLRKQLGAKQDLTEKYAGHINKFSRHSLFQLFVSQGFKIFRVRYSEHVLGQLLGLVVFKMMAKMAKNQKMNQLNNEQFFNQFNLSQGILFKLLKKTVNILVNLESYLLCRVPGANVHVVLKKL